MSDKNKMQALREEYIAFIERSGKSKNTANTTAAELFALWNNCGERRILLDGYSSRRRKPAGNGDCFFGDILSSPVEI